MVFGAPVKKYLNRRVHIAVKALLLVLANEVGGSIWF